MSVQSSQYHAGHESVHFFSDPAAGLRAIIAIHSTALGPAAGGCRRWVYASEQAALDDVLRLSRGMSFKNAMAGLPLGGGKAVILAEPGQPKTEALMEAFGRAVNSLGGRYVTAEDVGITIEDMTMASRMTSYISGLKKSGDRAGGDPSPKTAHGVYQGMLAAVKAGLGRTEVEGLAVAVQGLGGVGYHLCKNLHDAGAKLIVADVNAERVAKVVGEMGATAVSTEAILFAEADILAPCALGAIVNEQSIPKIRAKVIAGGANNQLAANEDGARLLARGILFAPDYVINAGGIINVAAEYLGTKNEAEVDRDIAQIHDRVLDIFARAKFAGQPANFVADTLAEAKIAQASLGERRKIA